MAQRTEKEETEFKVPEALTLCVNNCGVIGNPATNNMCQKCFNASNAATSSSASASVMSPKSGDSNLCGGPISVKTHRSTPIRSWKSSATSPTSTTPTLRSEGTTAEATKKVVNRCFCCQRKVGLTGFRCRCGELFCGEHRYTDRHECGYDYKSVGREAIARENPVVKAAKILRV